MFQQLLANKHHTLRDSKFGREKVWLCSPTKPCAEREPHSAHGRAVKIKINPVQSGAAEQEPRSAHGRAVKEYIWVAYDYKPFPALLLYLSSLGFCLFSCVFLVFQFSRLLLMSSPALRITPGMPLHGGDCVIPYITLKFLTGLVSNYGWVLSSTVVFLRGRHLFPT